MGWKLTWKAPKLAMVAKPLELSFEKIGTPPARVRLEIWESDERKHEVDDYRDKLKKSEKRDNDDLVAKFFGTIEPREPKGGIFKVTSGGPELSKAQANDYIVIQFEGSTKTYECGVPFDAGKEPVDGDFDGGFYEIYVRMFDADADASAGPIVHSDVHLVRRRTDLLLAVEPLNQCDATMSGGMGKMVLKYFHKGNNATSKRKWGDIILGTNNGNPTAKHLCQSACNYAVLCQVLRYFRRSEETPEGEEPPAKKKWKTIFEEVIEPELDDAFIPYTRVAGWSRFPLSDKEIKALSKKVAKAQGWKDNKATLVIDKWTDVPAGEERKAMRAVRKKTDSIPDHWWLPKLVQWVRKLESEGAAAPPDDDDMPQTSTCSWKGVSKTTGAEESIPIKLDDDSVMIAKRFRGTMDWTWVSDDGRVMPSYKKKLAKKLLIKQKAINHGKFKDWDKQLKKHLDKGMPAIAHIKSGCYLKPGEKSGGHYVLVVGYRKVGGVLRFIVNDSAGKKKLQYEAFRERDVSPSESNRQYLVNLAIEFVLTSGGVELGRGEAKFDDEDELNAALGGTFAPRKVDLTGVGAGISVKITYEGATSPAGTQNFGSHRYSVDVTVQGNPSLTAHHVQATSKPEKFTIKDGKKKKVHWEIPHSNAKKAKDTASHTEGDLKIDLVFKGRLEKKQGMRMPRPQEGLHDVLIGRRRFDSLFAIHLLEPSYGMEKGAAQFLVFDGKAQDPE